MANAYDDIRLHNPFSPLPNNRRRTKEELLEATIDFLATESANVRFAFIDSGS